VADATSWTASRLQQRRDELAAWRAEPLPDLFHRRGLRPVGAEPEPGVGLRGLGLTSGRVQGRAWVVREPDLAAEPPAGDGPLVLIAPAVEAGWIPLFSRVDAVVVEIGGELSHGSIVLREAGLPAITDVRGACAALRDGQAVLVDVDRGSVTPQ
jgi:pyruvate,water dikinase